MDEREALNAAVLAEPDDDLPRLVFADWLEEHGDVETARCIRAQIALAVLPEWDPQTVALRRTQAVWDCSESLARELGQRWPHRGLHWAEHDCLRRGFAYHILVPQLSMLQTSLPELLAEVPIQRLGLYTAMLDQWREFAASPWLPKIREIDFEGIRSPNEPITALLASPRESGLHTIRFLSCLGAGMPDVLHRLFRSPLGDGLRTLELAQAHGNDESYFEDFLGAFAEGADRLQTLRLRSMGLGGAHLHTFLTSRSWRHLEELSLFEAEPGTGGVNFLSYPEVWPALRAVKFDRVNVNYSVNIAEQIAVPNLALLEISNSFLHAENFRNISKAEHLAQLQVVRFRRMNCDNRGARYLTRAKFWKNLVELDLRGNRIDGDGGKHFLTRKPPPNLELLRLDSNFPDETRDRLQDHFEGKVMFGE